MRASRSAGVGIATAIALLVSNEASAHRLDEYLQAARIAVAPSRVDVELDLTPGMALADGVVADIDRNHDGTWSANERREYTDRVLRAVALEIDGRPLRLEPVAATFPEVDAVRIGEGTIQLRLHCVLPPMAGGAHQLHFHNNHARNLSVYLANALVPESPRVGITAQRRVADQRELTIDFDLRPASAAFPPARLAWSLAYAAGLAVLLQWRRRTARPLSGYSAIRSTIAP